MWNGEQDGPGFREIAPEPEPERRGGRALVYGLGALVVVAAGVMSAAFFAGRSGSTLERGGFSDSFGDDGFNPLRADDYSNGSDFADNDFNPDDPFSLPDPQSAAAARSNIGGPLETPSSLSDEAFTSNATGGREAGTSGLGALTAPLGDGGFNTPDPGSRGSSGPRQSTETIAAQKWLTAGSLAASFESEFACSSFSVRPGDDGGPVLAGTVASGADRDAVIARVRGAADITNKIEVGLGCTAELGGGFYALSDSGGLVRSLNSSAINNAVNEVLPDRSMCTSLGHVVAAQPFLSARLEEAGASGLWVMGTEGPALCYEAGENWAVRTPGRREGVALVYRGDLRAQAALLTKPARSASSAASTPSASRASSSASTTRTQERATRAAQTSGPLAVTPRAGPRQTTPAGVPISAPGVYVTVEFDVDKAGEASNLMARDAGAVPRELLHEAVRVVTESRFPPPKQGGDDYRGMYTVFFPPTSAAPPPDVLATLEAMRANGAATSRVNPLPAAIPSAQPSTTAAPQASAAQPAERANVAATNGKRAPNFFERVTRVGQGQSTVKPGPLPPPPQSSGVVWARRISGNDLQEVYPRRALSMGRGGSVQLRCVIASNLTIGCVAASEEPSGFGFGRAAVRASRKMKSEPRLADGRSAVGEVVNLRLVFELED